LITPEVENKEGGFRNGRISLRPHDEFTVSPSVLLLNEKCDGTRYNERIRVTVH
jgi:hypothetical protein